MKILFFTTHITTCDVANRWRVLIDDLNRNGVTDLMILTSRKAAADLVSQCCVDRGIKVGSLEEECWEEANNISSKSSENYLGSRTYLERLGEPDPDRWINKNKCLFENVLKRHEINRVCLAVGDAYNSPLFAVLEEVCRVHGIKTDLIQAPAFRIGVFDNLNRSSIAIQSIYEKKLATGLTNDERQRILNYCDAYRKFTTSTKVLSFGHQVRYPGSNILYAIYGRLKRKWSVVFDDLAPGEKDYFLFLPNKKDNYRQLLLTPRFSDNAMLAKRISYSLPNNTLLVVKDHPHTSRGALDYRFIKTVRALPNCLYVDPKEHTTDELIANARGVITVASTAIIDALVHMKPVLSFGQSPYLVNVDPLPVFNASSLEDLPELFKQMRQTNDQVERIEVFLYAFLSHTRSRLDGTKCNWGQDLQLNMDLDVLYRNYAIAYVEHLAKDVQ